MASSVSIPTSAYTLTSYPPSGPAAVVIPASTGHNVQSHAPQAGAKTPYAFGGSVERVTAAEDGQEYYIHAFRATVNEYYAWEPTDELVSGAFHVIRASGLRADALLVGGGSAGHPAEVYDGQTYYTFPGAGGTVREHVFDLPYGRHDVSVGAKGLHDSDYGMGGDTALFHPQYDTWKGDAEGADYHWFSSNDDYDEAYHSYSDVEGDYHDYYAGAGGGGDAVFPNGGPGYDASARYGTTWGENGVFAAGGSAPYTGGDPMYPNLPVRQVGRGPNTGCGFCAIGTDGYTLEGGDPPAEGIVLVRYPVEQTPSLASTPYAAGGFIVANQSSPLYQHYYVTSGEFEVTHPDGISAYLFIGGVAQGRRHYDQGTHTLSAGEGVRIHVEYDDPDPALESVTSSPFASGGDVYRVRRNGKHYYIHAFTAGTADFQSLLSNDNLNVDVLVVGGGCSTCDYSVSDGTFFWQGGSGGDVQQTTRTLTPGELVSVVVGAGGGALTTDGGESAFGTTTAGGGYHPISECWYYTYAGGGDYFSSGYEFDGVTYVAGAGAGGAPEYINAQDGDSLQRSPYVPGPGIDVYDTFGGWFGDHGYFGGGGGSGIAGGVDGLGAGAPNCGGGYSAIGATWGDWTTGTPASDGIVLVRYREPTVAVPRVPYWLHSISPEARLDFTQSVEPPSAHYRLRSLSPVVETGYFGHFNTPIYVIDEARGVVVTPVIEALGFSATLSLDAIHTLVERVRLASHGALGTSAVLRAQEELAAWAALRVGVTAPTADTVAVQHVVEARIAATLREVLALRDQATLSWQTTARLAEHFGAHATSSAMFAYMLTETVACGEALSVLVPRLVQVTEAVLVGDQLATASEIHALLSEQLAVVERTLMARGAAAFESVTVGMVAKWRARLRAASVDAFSIEDSHHAVFGLDAPAQDQTGFAAALTEQLNGQLAARDQFSFLGRIPLAEGDYAVWAFNADTLAASEYIGLAFEQIAAHRGRVFGVKPSGIYELTGDTDDGHAIDALIRTGLLDFGTSAGKAIRKADLFVKSDQLVYLRVACDNQGERREVWYELTPEPGEALQQRRVDLGRGAKGSRWVFEVTNTNGGALDLRGLSVLPVLLTRRRR